MITTTELKAIGTELQTATSISPELRARFIQARTALFKRGIYDPVLVRFDSYTAPKASAQEVGEQLGLVAEGFER
ncbi:MAG TPA: hypothetical protein VHW00_18065 [Thermoanaerobaculia bacterium]|nr:hypothetical protein [Thermoanaerobaculia bacterium]